MSILKKNNINHLIWWRNISYDNRWKLMVGDFEGRHHLSLTEDEIKRLHYKDRIIQFVEKYREWDLLIPEEQNHVVHLISNLVDKRDKKIPHSLGSFLTSVLENNLESAIAHADVGAYKALRIIVAAKQYLH